MDVDNTIAQCKTALLQKDLKRAHHWALSLIQQQPDQPDGYFYIAQVPMLAEQFDKAIPILEKALLLCDSTAQLYGSTVANLMQCYGLTGNASGALQVYRRLLVDSNCTKLNKLELSSLELDKLAVTLTRFEWHALALPLFERAIHSSSYTELTASQQANLQCNIAASYSYHGQTEKALSHYQKALNHKLTEGKASLAISRIKPMADTGRIKQLKSGLSNQDTNTLYFANALFNEYDKQEDYQQAADILCKANSEHQAELLRNNSAFSLSAHNQFIETIRTIASLVSSIDQTDKQELDQRPLSLFLVGLPRSGSTLLDLKISEHPEVMSLGERDDMEQLTSPILKTLCRLTNLREVTEADIQTVSKDLFAIAPEYRKHSVARIAGQMLAQSINTESQQAIDQEIRVVIDKMHLNIWYAPLVLALFSDAKIIAIKKNDRDLAWSNYKYLFNPQDTRFNYSYDLQNIQSYIDCYHQQITWLKSHYPERVIEIEYEKFVQASDEILREIDTFLTLSSRVKAQGKINSSPIYATASSQQIRKKVSGEYMEQWRNYEDLFENKKSSNPYCPIHIMD